jgi:hypothetical protein
MTDYTTSFKLSGIKHLADKFIDIQVTRLSDKSTNTFGQ